ncbi:glycoside hydrolase superfamily [Dipodascopsis uninucleata]
MKTSLLLVSVVSLLVAHIGAQDTIRGVNVGGWLILEKWLGGDIWDSAPDAVDEWTVCESLGDNATSAMQTHWSTFFTQDTVNQLASYGINALRIPIGYWSIISNSSEPYVTGAMDYLDQAIGWANTAGLKVWVDLHGVPGSQNGYDNSGHEGSVSWQTYTPNQQLTLEVLQILAAKYSLSIYSDTVVALELVNEPISWTPNDINITRQFYLNAYAAVQLALTDNKDLQIIMHDSFEDLSYWSDLPVTLLAQYGQIGLDTHIYQVFTSDYENLDGDGHLEAACAFQDTIGPSNALLSTYAGEWSAALDVCAYVNGTILPGEYCSEDGCQCTSDDPSTWNVTLLDYMRRFVEAQMDVFEGNGTGYFYWSHTGPGAWNFISGVEQGWIPQPLTDRKFPGQCGFTLPDVTGTITSKRLRRSYQRRVMRGQLGSL